MKCKNKNTFFKILLICMSLIIAVLLIYLAWLSLTNSVYDRYGVDIGRTAGSLVIRIVSIFIALDVLLFFIWHKVFSWKGEEAGTPVILADLISDEERYKAEEQYRKIMLAGIARVFEINVTCDLIRELHNASPKNVPWRPYTQEMHRLMDNAVYPEDKAIFLEVADRGCLLRAFSEGKTELHCEYRTLRDGKIAWSLSTTHLLHDPKTKQIKAFTYARDISEQKEEEISLRFMAQCDPLTGLYNRKAFEDMVQKILNMESKGVHAFLSIDLDRFKIVNDTFGHIEGDTLLKIVACRLKDLTRELDLAGRMGGDEFVLFLKDVRGQSYVEEVAYRLCENIRGIELTKKAGINISASVGIAIYPQHGSTFEELYRNSDSALYAAKQRGKDHYVVFHPDMASVLQ